VAMSLMRKQTFRNDGEASGPRAEAKEIQRGSPRLCLDLGTKKKHNTFVWVDGNVTLGGGRTRRGPEVDEEEPFFK